MFIALLAVAVAACAGGAPAGGTADVVARVPFERGERLTYGLHDNSGELVARGTFTVTGEGDALVLEQAYEAVGAPGEEQATDTIAVVVDAATLKPSRGRRLVTPRATADGGDVIEQSEGFEWRYAPGTEGAMLFAAHRPAGESEYEERELRLRDHHYDNESSLWLWRTLDLSEEYEARYVSVNHQQRSQQTVALRVTQRQTLEVPAGEFEVWRLQVRNGRATRVAWINVEPPHEIVQWDNGTLVFRLTQIGDADEP